MSSLKEKLLNCTVLIGTSPSHWSYPLMLRLMASGQFCPRYQKVRPEHIWMPLQARHWLIKEIPCPSPGISGKWSVCEKFSNWLKGHSFTVWTNNNNPLTYIITMTETWRLWTVVGDQTVPIHIQSQTHPWGKEHSGRCLKQSVICWISEPSEDLFAEVEGPKEEEFQDVSQCRIKCLRAVGKWANWEVW